MSALVRRLFPLIAAIAVLCSSGCRLRDGEPLTLGEAREALEEASLSNQASMLANGTIEISTNFTIGQAVERAAEEIHDFITTQLPCAEITLIDATLTVEYGAKPGNCTYRGHSYTGTHIMTVAFSDDGAVEIDHEWDDLSNGVLSVSGTANVTWSWVEDSRRVVHELTWTRLRDGRTGTGSGDWTYTLLDGGLLDGVMVDGWAGWDGTSGEWDLAIDQVELRWIDPVPQSGAFHLSTPFGKDVTMTFERVDEDTIAVIIGSGSKEFTIEVTSLDL
ncbi:MAG: hypothetical protein JRI23_06215 [Deltaproteobacteria bacterium]|jgi:hypothetical protein|nr:hypothetical protein [Deltaproteobacteria bacterium]MBW2531169.1 hypothetical protein [Deltaproteobacteria bacterium]